jgi:UDP-galactopyranose mutase
MIDSIKNCDIVIVGAGLFGSVVAEQASRDGLRIVVIESRDHIGGNCYTEDDEQTGINIHKYGPHIFHTSNERVWKYINQFTEFNSYRHQCMSRVGKKTYSMPMNLATINQWFKQNWSPKQAKKFFKGYATTYADPQNFEEQAMALLGNDLYRAFFREYTIKQWGKDPRELPASVARRLPVRYNYNTRYYNDLWEGIPVDGYTPIFEKMLSHTNIEVFLNTDFFSIRDQIPSDKMIVYTGAVDRYFDYKYGVLNWRTCNFVFKKFDVEDWQGVTQINYPSLDIPYTRTIEFKHFHPEKNYTKDATVVSFEYSRLAGFDDTPYYPVNTSDDREKYNLYHLEAKQLRNTIIGGRLGEYMYYDMHQVIGSALLTYEKRIKNGNNVKS